MSWYLRKSDQSVYGPVPEGNLCAWAAHGQVSPEDEISRDQQTWQPAPELAALQMDWLIEAGPEETFGPIHVLALAELVRDGSLTADQRVRHKSGQPEGTLAEIVLPALLDIKPSPELQASPEVLRLQQELETARQRIAGLEQQVQHPVEDPQVARLQLALAEARQRVVEMELARSGEADPQVARLQEELSSARQRIAELEQAASTPAENPELPRLQLALAAAEQRIVDLETRAAPAADPELPRLRDALSAAEARIHELEERPAPAAPAPPADNGLMDSYRELSANYDRLLNQLDEKSQELTQTIEANNRVIRDMESRMTGALEAATVDRAAADGVRLRLAELEQTHRDLVRSYRDLNDRYIRLRQQQKESGVLAPAPAPTPKSPVRLV